jgi:hypothetical protein
MKRSNSHYVFDTTSGPGRLLQPQHSEYGQRIAFKTLQHRCTSLVQDAARHSVAGVTCHMHWLAQRNTARLATTCMHALVVAQTLPAPNNQASVQPLG